MLLINELKRNFKSPIFLILLVLIIIITVISIVFSIEDYNRDVLLKNNHSNYDIFKNENPTIEFKEEDYEEVYNYIADSEGVSWQQYSNRARWELYNYQDESLNELFYKNYIRNNNAIINKDIEEYNKTKLFDSLIKINDLASGYWLSDKNQSKLDEINNLAWDDVSDGARLDDFEFDKETFGGIGGSGTYIIENYLFRTEYYYYLYKNDVSPVKWDYLEWVWDEPTNLSNLYKYMKNILPLLIIVIPILLSYDSINKDINTGAIKLLLTQGVSKTRIYFSKYLANILMVIILLIFSLLFVNLFSYFYLDDYVPIKYPIVYDKEGLSTFESEDNFEIRNNESYKGKELFTFYEIPYNTYTLYMKSLTKDILVPHYQRIKDFIMFDKVILLSIAFSILFVGFITSLTFIFSTLFNDRLMSISITMGVFGLFYILTYKYVNNSYNNISPFHLNNGLRIVQGTYNVTMLGAFIILLVSILFLNIVGYLIFKKKES